MEFPFSLSPTSLSAPFGLILPPQQGPPDHISATQILFLLFLDAHGVPL